MRLFVTGICGALGRTLSLQACAAGHTVVGINRSPWPEDVHKPDGVEVISASLEESDKYASYLEDCDVVVHGAALHLNNGLGKPLADFIHANVEQTARLLDVGREAGIQRFVLCSSMTVIIGGKGLANGMGRFDERTSPKLLSNPQYGNYPFSKILMEKLAEEYASAYDVSVCCLRHMAFSLDKDIDDLAFGLLGLWLTCEDAARACLLAAVRDGFRGDCFNIGAGSPLSNQDIRDAQSDPWAVLERHYPGCREVLEPLNLVPMASHFSPVACNHKSKRMLDYEPQDNFGKWLRTKGWA